MPAVSTPRPWSVDEDVLLKHAVAQHGDEPGMWKTIAQHVPGRTNKACRKRWLHSLSPTIKKTPWTADEDATLLRLYSAHAPPRWSLIARHIPGRTDDACAKRYREALDPQLKRDDWTAAEDARLVELTQQLGSKWTQVGQAMGRSGLGCRNRWRLLQRKQRPRVNVVPRAADAPLAGPSSSAPFAEDAPAREPVYPLPPAFIPGPPPGQISTTSSLTGALAPLPAPAPAAEPEPEPEPQHAPEPEPEPQPEPQHPPDRDDNDNDNDDPIRAPTPRAPSPPPPPRRRSSSSSSSSPPPSAPPRKRARLASHLPATLDRTVRPYGCGAAPCSACFATAAELAEHRRAAHPDATGRLFRCALQGCEKAWKNLNGIQYHLQVSKAHFRAALSEAAPDAGTRRNAKKEHRCPRPGCPNAYKQRTGLQYHLAHGHPKDVAQLPVLPPGLVTEMQAEDAQ